MSDAIAKSVIQEVEPLGADEPTPEGIGVASDDRLEVQIEILHRGASLGTLRSTPGRGGLFGSGACCAPRR